MTISRRGFLGAMLALGAAPAIVKAQSIMPLWVPKNGGEILLPELNIVLGNLDPMSNQPYTFSMWIKAPDGAWERHVQTFKANGLDTASISIPLKQKDPVVYGIQLEGITHKRTSVNMRVTQNSSMRLDVNDTPFNTRTPTRYYHTVKDSV